MLKRDMSVYWNNIKVGLAGIKWRFLLTGISLTSCGVRLYTGTKQRYDI